MDVKNILMETVSHHILPQMLVSSLWVESNNLLRDYLRFMDDHLRESADLTFLAYRHRNYSKVCDCITLISLSWYWVYSCSRSPVSNVFSLYWNCPYLFLVNISSFAWFDSRTIFIVWVLSSYRYPSPVCFLFSWVHVVSDHIW